MFKGLILPAFAIVGLLSAMSAISSDEVTKPSDLDATMHVEQLVLGSGCFWGAEKRYEALNGVLDAESGYADGHGFKPTYRNITKLSRRFDAIARLQRRSARCGSPPPSEKCRCAASRSPRPVHG